VAPPRKASRAIAWTDAERFVAAAERASRAGRVEEAAELYARALRSSPSFVPARVGYATAAWDLGREEEARAAYRALLDEAPQLAPPIARVRAANRFR